MIVDAKSELEVFSLAHSQITAKDDDILIESTKIVNIKNPDKRFLHIVIYVFTFSIAD